MAPSEQLDYQIKTIRALIANTSADQMGNATPCDKWAVRDLMTHLVGGGQMFGMALKGEPVTMDEGAPAPDVLGDDPLAAWDGACKTFREGMDSPGALDRVVTLPFGEMPGSVVLEILRVDLLVHAWDLAQATDQPFDPPAEVVQAALDAAPMIIAPPLRDAGLFGAEVTAPAAAKPMEQLAAFAGRSV